jgi:hypothetical protein
VKPKVQLEETRFKLRRDSKSFEPFTLDRTQSLSRPDASGQCWQSLRFNSVDRTRSSHGPDAVIGLTRVREGKRSDRTRLGKRSYASTVRPVQFQRGTSLTGRVRSSPIELDRASGQSTVRFLHDWTRPVSPDRTRCASGHSAQFVSNPIVATDLTRPVMSTSASGQYIKC